MSTTSQHQARAQAWLDQACATVRGRTRLAIAAGIGASLVFAAFAAAVAVSVQAWLTPQTRSAWPLIAIPLLLALRSGLLALRDWAGARAAATLRAQVRDQLLDVLQRLGPLRSRAGDDGALATLALEQVDALDGYVSRYLPQRWIAAGVPLLLLLLVIPCSWLAALLLAVTAPLIPFFMTLVGWGAAAAAQEQAQALARLGGQFLDLVRGLPTLRLLAAVDGGARRLAHSAAEYRERSLSVLRLAFLSSAVLELFAAVSIAMLALYLGLALLGRIEIGHYGLPMQLDKALFLLLLAPEFFAPLRQLGSDYHARADALAAAQALAALQDRVPAAPVASLAAAATQAPIAAAPLIEFDNVSLVYPDGRVALDAVSFRIEPGERVLLRGPSGSGKSSVLALLAGFIAPTSGCIRIDGQDLSALDRAAWWHRLGWLEQRPEWFRLPLRDNVLLGLDRGDDARLWSALQRAGLADDVRQLPRGADSVLGEADGSLSGGQLQRVALARALARDARLWLLDEPLAHLDAETAEALRQTLAYASTGRSVLIASHASEDRDWTGRELRFERGRLCAHVSVGVDSGGQGGA